MDKETVGEYLDFYSETQGVLPERLDEFGEKFKNQGFLTREQLYDIAFESSTRSAYHVEKNPKERCKEVTRNVLEIEGDFSQIALIEALKGFKAPTASCVLAALDPEKHAVVDTRVWASLQRMDCLDSRKETFTASDYVEMMKYIREIADKTGYRPVDVGYALFAYDVDKREGTLH